MDKKNKYQEFDAVIAAEPLMTYGRTVSVEKKPCQPRPLDYDSDMQRAIPVEEFRCECHKELRRMYGKV